MRGWRNRSSQSAAWVLSLAMMFVSGADCLAAATGTSAMPNVCHSAMADDCCDQAALGRGCCVSKHQPTDRLGALALVLAPLPHAPAPSVAVVPDSPALLGETGRFRLQQAAVPTYLFLSTFRI